MANRITVILEALGFDKASSHVKGFRKSIVEAEGVTNKFKAGASSAMQTVNANAGSLAVMGGAAFAGFGVKAVHAFTDTAKAAIDLSKATGLSTEQASRWIAVGDDFQVSAEQLTAGIGRIGKTLNDTKWAEYGIATHDAGGEARSTNDILADTLAMLSDVGNETERTRIGNDLFGRGYSNLAPLIGHTADEYKEMLGAVEAGQVITSKEAEKAERMRLAEDALADALNEVTLAFGEMVAEMAPLIEMGVKLGGVFKSIDGLIPDWLGKFKLGPVIGAISTVSDGVSAMRGEIETGISSQMPNFRQELEDAEAAAAKLRAEAEDRLTPASEELAEAFGRGWAKADDLQDVMKDAADEARELADGERAAEEAADDLADAQGRAEDKADDLRDAWDELKGSLSDDQAFIDVQDSFADMNAAALEAWGSAEEAKTAQDEAAKAAASGADDAEQKYIDAANATRDAEQAQRDYKSSIIDTKQGVIDYAKEVLGLPKEQVTTLIAMLDEGDVADVERRLAILTRNRNVNLQIVARGGAGFSDSDRYGGARAHGGSTQPGMFYRVGEGGNPELYRENGETFLIPGGRGMVTPASATGGVTFTSTPIGGQATQAAAAPSGPTPEEQAREAEEAAREAIEREDRIQAAMFETGDISLAAYRKYLEGRMAASDKYDDAWMQSWRLLRQLREEESRQSEEAAQAELKRQEEAAQATLDRIKLAYEQAKALRELQQAERDVADAMDDIREAEEDLWNADDEDKDRAAEGVQRAIERAAEEMFRGAGARASANGLAANSPEWARFVRAEVEAAMQAFPQLAGVLGQLLVGVPNLAHGGIVKARPGGTLIRAGEAGRDEAVVPLPMNGAVSRPIYLTVNAGIGTNGQDVGSQIVKVLKQYELANGKVFSNS